MSLILNPTKSHTENTRLVSAPTKAPLEFANRTNIPSKNRPKQFCLQ